MKLSIAIMAITHAFTAGKITISYDLRQTAIKKRLQNFFNNTHDAKPCILMNKTMNAVNNEAKVLLDQSDNIHCVSTSCS